MTSKNCEFLKALHWLSGGWIGKDSKDNEENGQGESFQPQSRKSSVYLRKQKANEKNMKPATRTTKKTFADRIGIKH